MMTRVINFYGGPGSGKSTMAAALFADLKFRGVNCELVTEYAKEKVWELGDTQAAGALVFNAEDYLFSKQHYRLRRCEGRVDVIITDSPLLQKLIYIDKCDLPSLRPVILDAYALYDNHDFFVVRAKLYNPKGRYQTEDQARVMDGVIREKLATCTLHHGLTDINYGRWTIKNLAKSIVNASPDAGKTQ